MKDKLIQFYQEEDGLTVVESAVAGGLITAAVVAAFTSLGLTVSGIIAAINVALGG